MPPEPLTITTENNMSANPTPAPASEFKFDEKKFTDHLNAAEEYLHKFQGQKGHNPFFKINEIKAFRERFAAGERTPVLFNAALGIKQTPPLVNSSPTEQSQATKQQTSPIGLTLPDKRS